MADIKACYLRAISKAGFFCSLWADSVGKTAGLSAVTLQRQLLVVVDDPETIPSQAHPEEVELLSAPAANGFDAQPASAAPADDDDVFEPNPAEWGGPRYLSPSPPPPPNTLDPMMRDAEWGRAVGPYYYSDDPPPPGPVWQRPRQERQLLSTFRPKAGNVLSDTRRRLRVRLVTGEVYIYMQHNLFPRFPVQKKNKNLQRPPL